MGVAAYNRGSAAIGRDIAAGLAEVRNHIDARALFWRDLMAEGHVLTFRHGGTGGTFTAGPYQSAMGGFEQFALLWSGAIPRGMRDWFGLQAWDVAVRIVQHVGRQRPVMIDGEQQ
jgi:hypothetical protein